MKIDPRKIDVQRLFFVVIHLGGVPSGEGLDQKSCNFILDRDPVG